MDNNSNSTETQKKDFISEFNEKSSKFWIPILNMIRKFPANRKKKDVSAERVYSLTQFGREYYTPAKYAQEQIRGIQEELETLIGLSRRSTTEPPGDTEIMVQITKHPFNDEALFTIKQWVLDNGYTCDVIDRSKQPNYRGNIYLIIGWTKKI